MSYSATDYINFIEMGRFDKISNYGLELIAESYRNLEKGILDHEKEILKDFIGVSEFASKPFYYDPYIDRSIIDNGNIPMFKLKNINWKSSKHKDPLHSVGHLIAYYLNKYTS